ncbi:RNA polymerase sigma factor [Flavobacterium aurantiibacter]|uniref:RNA polymerase sigma factor n=1 Tax=Flavobacterium aurantiibacter TaxID=2023067 RepID=A0A255ZM71_9FLAO|nr:RNA polymerase sigma factor [Flavobacterium aurantiibacter]OYQ42512.1 RNA polymerase subunit sigma-70 [Flavobacterium aurantiibacter]
MQNPFSSNYRDKSDDELIDSAVNGSVAALEALIYRHQHFIYNIALKMMGNVQDAQDITQEVLIKIITKLSQFKKEGNFRTWLYRITFNHFLQMKKSMSELATESFEVVEKQLDSIPSQALSLLEESEMRDEIEETKLACMNGMLLCLERDQRLVFILGELFNVNHDLGANLLNISKDNFRQKLSRARKDLYNFMNNKCGLIRKENPCRCAGKTKGFIRAGKVNPDNLQFNKDYLKTIQEVIGQKKDEYDDFVTDNYAEIYGKHPFQEKEHAQQIFDRLINNKSLNNLFGLKKIDDLSNKN